MPYAWSNVAVNLILTSPKSKLSDRRIVPQFRSIPQPNKTSVLFIRHPQVHLRRQTDVLFHFIFHPFIWWLVVGDSRVIKLALLPRRVMLLLLLLLLLSPSSSSSSSSPLCTAFILLFLRQTMSLRNTVLQLFCCYYSWCLYR